MEDIFGPLLQIKLIKKEMMDHLIWDFRESLQENVVLLCHLECHGLILNILVLNAKLNCQDIVLMDAINLVKVGLKLYPVFLI
jgi:hypothetical protein